LNKKTDKCGTNKASCGRIAAREVADWMPTSLLEDEIFNAIQDAGPASSADDVEYEEIDDSVDEDDECEDEEEERRSAYRLLSYMRPQLSELLAKSQDL
jgi:hypothetical protein